MELDIGILFIDELLVISESGTLDFSNSDLFVDGRNKENKVSKLRINWIVSRSVIYLSGSTQGSEFWADLLKVSSLLETFWFLWWIVIIIGNNKLKNLSISELLVTNESVEHRAIFCEYSTVYNFCVYLHNWNFVCIWFCILGIL